MAGLPLLVVLAVLAAAGASLAVQVARGRVRSADLPLPVAAARARGTRWSAAALVAGLGTVGALAALALARRSETLVLLAPLTGAGVHAATALLGELTWPRPGGRVRSARLVARSIRASAPPALLGTAVAAGLLVLAACVAGTLLAGAAAQTWTWRTERYAAGSQVPGGAVALPLLAAWALTALATAAVLHRMPVRPAVPCAPAAVDAALRRTGAHRVLRVSTSALLGTAGVLLVRWSHFATTWRSTADVLTGEITDGPLAALAGPVVTAGLLLVLAGAVVLLLPARGLRSAPRAVAA